MAKLQNSPLTFWGWELCEWQRNVNKWIYKVDFLIQIMKAISFPYTYTYKKRVKARRVFRRKYWNKKGKRKSSFVKDYFPSINLLKHHGFPPQVPWWSKSHILASTCFFFHIFLELWREQENKCIHTGGSTPSTHEHRSRNPNTHF